MKIIIEIDSNNFNEVIDAYAMLQKLIDIRFNKSNKVTKKNDE